MSFRLFLRCCLPSKSREKERKTEIAVKKIINEAKDNSYDKSDIDIPSSNKKDNKDVQQSQPVVEELPKPTIEPNKNMNSQQNMYTEEIHPPKNISPPIENTATAAINPPQEIKNISNDSPIQVKKEEEKKEEKPIEILGKKLILKVIESNSLQKESEIKIHPSGYPESKRKAYDCNVYFGVVEEVDQSNTHYINDFVLPNEENGFGKRHFVINFVEKENNYYIKDLADGTGTFSKILKPMSLTNGNILSFGDSHLVVNISTAPNGKNEKLTVKFIEGPKIDQIYNFDIASNPITIGRVEGNKISVKSTTLSRHQCQIEYNSTSDHWIVTDGDGKKGSTNGTWAFMEQPFLVTEGMIFKAGQTLFECHFSDN